MGPLFVPAGKIQSERDAAGRKSLPAEVQLVDLFACDYYRGAKLGGQEPTASEGLRRGSNTADNGFMRHTILYNPKVLRIILESGKERLQVVCARARDGYNADKNRIVCKRQRKMGLIRTSSRNVEFEVARTSARRQ